MKSASRGGGQAVRWAAVARLLVAAGLVGSAATLAAPPPQARPAEARAEILLPGRWLRGAASSGGAWLLVADGPQAPRRLLELRWREARTRAVAGELPAAVERIVPPGGAGAPLLLTGGGTVLAIDAARGAVGTVDGAGEVLGGPGGDGFGTAPPWLADARLGEVRPIRLAGRGVEALGTQALPIAAERASWGLRLSSPPLAFAGPWLVVGPQQEGRRVRTLLFGPAGERVEHVGVLPEPEQISDRAVVIVDGRPLLVLGTFRGIGLASKKRLRVFALDGGGGDAGTAPLIARELPARMWNEMEVRAVDLDGDGREDLVVANAEGLSGDSVAFTTFAGRGGGRLSPQPVAGSVAIGGAAWRYGDVTGDGRPDLVTLADGRVGVHAAAGATGLPGKKATATYALGGGKKPPREQVQVSVGTGGSRVDRSPATRETPGDEPAGAAAATDAGGDGDDDEGDAGWELVDLDGDGILEVARWEPAPQRQTRLSVLGLGARLP